MNLRYVSGSASREWHISEGPCSSTSWDMLVPMMQLEKSFFQRCVELVNVCWRDDERGDTALFARWYRHCAWISFQCRMCIVRLPSLRIASYGVLGLLYMSFIVSRVPHVYVLCSFPWYQVSFIVCVHMCRQRTQVARRQFAGSSGYGIVVTRLLRLLLIQCNAVNIKSDDNRSSAARACAWISAQSTVLIANWKRRVQRCVWWK